MPGYDDNKSVSSVLCVAYVPGKGQPDTPLRVHGAADVCPLVFR